ncbi:hypothetical protein [Gordonia sp. 852002-50395_SCH5434458]|uniref:hypothetical protein n=1 Tax=Gordonia sp. 852002-50395_SCH5434458 TaxID=1834090 RepID=UPI0007E9CA89|nr:hypothetical protein [Gordonia sp. 852002-50395_SCH5434458]OBC01741.1 hypothetical protein A5785_17230 [Gordonia sp. 852002-50395_SCH5434458]
MHTTFPTTDTAWINRRIRRGILSPAARGMTAEDAATQHNEANCLTESDADYLYSPRHAQRVAHDLLRFVDLEIADHRDVVLTDRTAGPRAGGCAVNCGQIETAAEQYRLITGEAISADALLDALPWV